VSFSFSLMAQLRFIAAILCVQPSQSYLTIFGVGFFQTSTSFFLLARCAEKEAVISQGTFFEPWLTCEFERTLGAG
jgi:hypothetical protein